MNSLGKFFSLTVLGASLLTGDFQKDIDKLANCSILDNLLSRRQELGRELNTYEKKLYRVLYPWYKQNCSKS
jgi:hypothetical protein